MGVGTSKIRWAVVPSCRDSQVTCRAARPLSVVSWWASRRSRTRTLRGLLPCSGRSGLGFTRDSGGPEGLNCQHQEGTHHDDSCELRKQRQTGAAAPDC